MRGGTSRECENLPAMSVGGSQRMLHVGRERRIMK